MVTKAKIAGQELVSSTLGYWPEFCDARVLELSLLRTDSGANLSILIHYIDTDRGFDSNVRIDLLEIVDMEFQDLMVENVIDCMLFKVRNDNGLDFEIEAAAGFSGWCSCKSAKVELESFRKRGPQQADGVSS